METILVDKDHCTRCGICSAVCTMGLIDPGTDDVLPHVPDEKALMCIRCGHCEAFCPENALLLNERIDEKVVLPKGAGTIAPEDLGFYIKKRRSIRNFTKEPVLKETILEILDIARYAASGTNSQPVRWLVIHDPKKVQRVAELTIEYMRALVNTDHPMSAYAPMLVSVWDHGYDIICRGAPHLLVAYIPEASPIAPVDGIIALTHVDIAAPAFGVGTCWAGFVAMAANTYEPLKSELGLTTGWKCAYAMMFGHPKYNVYGIPRRKPLDVKWI